MPIKQMPIKQMSVEIKPTTWDISTSSTYSSWIKKTFQYSKNDQEASASASASALFPHQRFVRDFLQEDGPNRGLLLYHGLGVGKTRSAIAIAEASVKRTIFVLLPASLQPNFEREVVAVGGKHAYNFIRYDGLNTKSVAELPSFDNSIVIIDEVHTFISRSLGDGKKVSKKVYQLLMDATNCKIVALSGTPIINSPIELAYTLNLVHGYTWSHIFRPLKGHVLYDAQKEVSALANVAKTVARDDGTLAVTYWPAGFAKSTTTNILVKLSTKTIPTVQDVFKNNKIAVSVRTSIEKSTLFPIDQEAFNEQFVDYATRRALDTDGFSQKVKGLVSYFESYDMSTYPLAKPIEIVRVPMKNIQFGKYITVRQREVDKELKAKLYGRRQDDNNNNNNNNSNNNSSGSVYRSFSRAMCNFVFPDEIDRPYPSTMKQFTSEVDEFAEDIGGSGGVLEASASSASASASASAKANALYNKKVAEALVKLRQNADTYLSRQGLAEHGPKMREIMDRLETCPGTALVYSSFRNVEGIKILSLAMEHEGYVELQVKKVNQVWKLQCSNFAAAKKYIVFTSNKEETRILMHLFNSSFDLLPESINVQLKKLGLLKTTTTTKQAPIQIVQVLMITQSGAQGISLKNVRQVHVMEPFWNNVRVQQVQGRAVRAWSHAQLPPKDRVVETFVYIMALVAKEHVNHTLIKAHDDGLSSDGYIYDIAARKTAVNEQFLQLVKNASIDCELNKKAHGSNVECFGQKNKTNKDKRRLTFRAFLNNKFPGRKFEFLTNPTDEETTKFSLDRTGAGWTGLYENKKLVGVVKVVDGVPKAIVFNKI